MNNSNTVLGIDIGTSHIKAVSIERGKTQNKLLRYAIAPSKGFASKILSESKQDIESVSQFLKTFLLDNGFEDTQVVAVIPEQKVFSKIVTMPAMSGQDFKQAIEWEAEQHLPQSLSEVYLKYEVQGENSIKKDSGNNANTSSVLVDKRIKYINKAKDVLEAIHGGKPNIGNIDVLLVSVARNFIDKYLGIINGAGLAPLGLEPTSIATIRSVIENDVSVPTIIINFGHSNADFYLSVDNNLRFVRPLSFGVSSVIRAISQELDVSPIQANEYLFTYGLKENVLNGRIREIIMPVIKIIISELKKSQQYIESRASLFGGEIDHHVRRAVLIGGGAMIPDIMVYLIQEVTMEVQLGDAWKSLDMSAIGNSKGIEPYGPLFAAAVGAGLK